MAQYQGHRSWNSWNVSLWINNDEGLYNLARDLYEKAAKKLGRNAHNARKMAARWMLEYLPEKTPDGGRYNVTCVFEAMEEMLD